MITTDELRRFPLLKHIADADLDALARVLRRGAYPAGALLFRQGDPGETMLLISAGQVRIFLNDEQGNDITLRTLGAGQIIGEFALLDRQARSASAAALAPLDVLILERDDFLRLLGERPLVGVELMRSLAERIRYSTSYLERLLRRRRTALQQRIRSGDPGDGAERGRRRDAEADHDVSGDGSQRAGAPAAEYAKINPCGEGLSGSGRERCVS